MNHHPGCAPRAGVELGEGLAVVGGGSDGDRVGVLEGLRAMVGCEEGRTGLIGLLDLVGLGAPAVADCEPGRAPPAPG
jgi:hypothetical protein